MFELGVDFSLADWPVRSALTSGLSGDGVLSKVLGPGGGAWGKTEERRDVAATLRGSGRAWLEEFRILSDLEMSRCGDFV